MYLLFSNQNKSKCTAIALKRNTISFFAFFEITGPSLPYGLCYSAMAESPDGRGVLLFGGSSDENFYEDRILELRAGANSWNILNITLQIKRGMHVAIPLH